MVAGLFGTGDSKQHNSPESNTDNALWSAAGATSTIGTAEAVRGFQKRTKEDNQRYKEQLKQRAEFSRNWQQYLAMNLQWQKVDLFDTKAFTKWRVQTFKNLGTKGLIVAQGDSQQRVIGAVFKERANLLQESEQERIDTTIERLRQARDAARNKLRGKR